MKEFLGWLDSHALALDEGDEAASQALLGKLGRSGALRVGVSGELGGAGGSVGDAVDAIAQVARHSLTAAFVFWGQRAFIEYLLHSPNAGLRERALPGLLAGDEAGATGLSNAMKFLSGIEQLGVRAESTPQAGTWTLQGRVPWATNLGRGFRVALAVAQGDGKPPLVLAVPQARAGVSRSADLDLIALRGSQTAALTLADVPVSADDLIHPVATEYLPRVRPAFLGLQCGLSIGLAQAALAAAREHLGAARAVLSEPLAQAEAALSQHHAALLEGLAHWQFLANAPALFRLRIALAHDVQQALQLELLTSGGRAYHRDQPLGFARRWRESAFIPIVTPSLSQLQGELAKLAA